jgi:ATP-dependent DNA helicase RecG
VDNLISKKSAAELVAELNETDETESLEAKSIAEATVGKSLFETICAMSNEPGLEGGTILLGVEKEELSLFPLFSAVGVRDTDKACSDIASTCATIFNTTVRTDLHVERIGKANVIRIDVPELPAHQKPLYLVSRGLPKGAYRRIGPTDQRCSEEDMLSFFRGKENTSYDRTVIAHATFDDIDPQAIEAYRKSRRDANPAADELSWTDEDLVHALGGLHRLDGQLRVTIAGLVTFGKSTALRRLYPSHRVDYIRVPGNTWVKDVSAQFDAIEVRGPLVTLASRVIATILDDLPRAFRFDDQENGQRSELPLLPVRAIREAVVNCLIHRNYQSAQPIQIVRYGNRIEFKNPGHSLKSVERFDDPASIMRNPHIAEVMHETRYAETKGSGIRRMRQLMEDSGLSSPTFESDRDADSFSAVFLFHHFLSTTDWEWLSKFRDFELTDDQRRAIIYVREVGAIANQTYREINRTDTLAASKSLRKLRTANLLADRGSGSGRYYVAGTELIDRLAPNSLATGDNSLHIGLDSLASREQIKTDDLPEVLKVRVKLIALGRRDASDHIPTTIMALCAWKPLSASQIGGLLDRNPTYLTTKYLSVLIANGTLEYLYSDQPNHPNQKYVPKQ